LNKESIKKSIIYSQLAIVIIGLILNSAFAMTPIILLGDPAQVTEKAEKACTFLCQLDLFGKKFVDTKEGRTTFMWLGYYVAVYGAKSLGLLATPVLGRSAMLIIFICTSTYGISTLVGNEAIEQSEFFQTANVWCVKTYAALFGIAGLPTGGVTIDKGIVTATYEELTRNGLPFLQISPKCFKMQILQRHLRLKKTSEIKT
jgi:hypothetical protein